MLKEFSLDGRFALVTGGSKGLGYVMAEALARAGAEVAVTSRQESSIKTAADRLTRATGRRIVPLAADVTRRSDVEVMTEKTLEAFGRLDILVNNAGINIRKPTVEQSEEEFREILDTNLLGAFRVARAVGRHLVRQKSGVVINVASMIGLVGLAGRPGYTSSKGGLIQLTRTMALEWAPLGIRVNALCPGPFATEINTPVLNDPEASQSFVQRIPLGRWGKPAELGPAAVFLASDASSFMTGATLVIDGGWTAQ
ncbi:MAG: glucose 1-dehydrogenase [Phycisphaerales bacterium]|nr:glucose 1-dehydrogenase [Phycisphaerales bacterium]